MTKNSLLYSGNDMGAVYTKDKTSFRIFSPDATEVVVCFYKEGNGDCFLEEIAMSKDVEGTWATVVEKDLNGVYYTYKVTTDGVCRETQDPYAKAVGVNGTRSMVVDLAATNPEGFEKDCGPVIESEVDVVVCEISVCDTTGDASSGAKNLGTYLGMTEIGTKNKDGMLTGLSHYKDLGVTHLQIMPSFDFGSIDEAAEEKGYNWGYDPINYNVPEGSFSTDPFHGEVRIKEFKQMVQAIHSQGMGVIMDVVYNHTYNIDDCCLQKAAPDYYYRKENGVYSDASACGNEVASERPMVRKYIVDSLRYWVEEYHIDGFRFDLMGCLDIETMNLAAKELRKIRPDIILYGEGWTGGPSVLPESKRAVKVLASKLDGIGMFSDDIRDGVKGHVFYEEQKGFVNGGVNKGNDIRYSLVGAIKHPQVDYDVYEYTAAGAWNPSPTQIVNYVSCHDNHTLWDKLSTTCPGASEEELLKKNRLSTAIVLMAQGIPFFLSGEEFARTKPIEGTDEVSENSYNLPRFTNTLKYERLTEFRSLSEYYKGLIAFRKEQPLLRLRTAEEVVSKVKFIDYEKENVVVMTITDKDQSIFAVFNASGEAVTVSYPEEGDWQVKIDGNCSGTKVLRTENNQTTVEDLACLVAVKSNR